LKDGYTPEEFGRELEESAERRKREGNKSREVLNASWQRIEDFDREWKRKDQFGRKVLGWFLGTVFAIGGVVLGWQFLKGYIFQFFHE